jgi:hypothetical protein
VSSVTVAETVRGHGPGDATVNRVLVSLDDVGLISEETARQAGALLGRAGSAATVDALVAAEAIRRAPCILLTTDPDDLRRLLAGYPQVRVRAI